MTADFLEQLARTRSFRLGVPRDIMIVPDGDRVLFLRSAAGDDPVTSLWRLDLDSGEERLLADGAVLAGGELSAAERALRERTREQAAGIVGYHTDAAMGRAVFTVDGHLWMVEVDGGQPRRLAVPGSALAPRLAPSGEVVSYVSAGALRVVDIDGGGEHAVAVPEADEVSYGLPEHVAGESMFRFRGYWWAPDSSRLLVSRVDNTPVQRWYLSDPANPGTAPTEVRYPVAGTDNAEVTLWLYRPDGSARTEVVWDRAGFEYLAAVSWTGEQPYLLVQSRDQRTVQIRTVDPETGATTLVHEDHDDAWWELVGGLPAVTGSGVLVWTTDAEDDTRKLTVDGVPVTPAGLQVREVLGVSGESVTFRASSTPTEVHVWRWQPDTGAVQLSTGPGVHTGQSCAGVTVLSSRSLDHPGVQVISRPDSGREVRIASRAQVPVLTPRVTMHRFGDRELCSAVLLPSGHQRGAGRLPVLLLPYGGPHAQLALHAQGLYLRPQWYADQGYAVLVCDGRGTPGHSPAWEKSVRGDKLGLALADQVDALHAAAREYPEFDLDRVGISGWSYGGYLSAGAVLRRPDVFHVAVAGAPITDPLLYDTHWQERYLGHPQIEPENYSRCSLIPDAPGLRRPLMLVHGLADDNVVVAHTLRLSGALLAAGREHTVLPITGATHMTGAAVAASLPLLELAFLDRVLRPESSRD